MSKNGIKFAKLAKINRRQACTGVIIYQMKGNYMLVITMLTV